MEVAFTLDFYLPPCLYPCSLNRVVTKDPAHPHHGIAKFNLLGKVVYHVGSNKPETMRAICTNKDLSFSQGNQFLFAGIQGAGQKGLNEEGEMDATEKREMKDLAKAITPRSTCTLQG